MHKIILFQRRRYSIHTYKSRVRRCRHVLCDRTGVPCVTSYLSARIDTCSHTSFTRHVNCICMLPADASMYGLCFVFLYSIALSMWKKLIWNPYFSEEDIRFLNVRNALNDVELHHASELECRLVHHVCQLVSTRAATLASLGASSG